MIGGDGDLRNGNETEPTVEHLAIKGVMLDMARVTERHSYYRALPERLAAWGYNTIFAHFTDDEGCAMRFSRRPELATPHAFTPDQMRTWVRQAARAGLSVIPEIESFGHTGYIHGRRKYAALREPTSGHFNAINPLARQTKAILRDLVQETAEVFDSPFIHAGLDEVNFGASAAVRRALRQKESWQIFADHVDLMRRLIESTGRRMMMWGDHLLHEPKLADAVSRDIIICDWHYQADVSSATVEFFTKRGFEVVCCPASNRSGDMVLPNATTQINLQRFARIAHQGGRRVVGLMNTVWCPHRMLCGIEQFAMALGGAWFSDPSADPVETVARFQADQYGLPRAERTAKAVLALSAATPHRNVLRRLLDSEPLPAGPLTAREAEQAGDLFEQAMKLGTLFSGHLSRTRRNGREFANYFLAAELLAWSALAGLARTPRMGPGMTRRSLLSEGRRLLKRCQSDWNRGRHADDPKRDLNGRPERWTDALIPNLHLALARLGEPADG